jgi:hypothetical protein
MEEQIADIIQNGLIRYEDMLNRIINITEVNINITTNIVKNVCTPLRLKTSRFSIAKTYSGI